MAADVQQEASVHMKRNNEIQTTKQAGETHLLKVCTV